MTQTPAGAMQLFQVALSLKNEETRSREVRALSGAMEELSLRTGIIVTLEEEEEISLPQGNIFVVPAWRFLLGHPRSGRVR